MSPNGLFFFTLGCPITPVTPDFTYCGDGELQGDEECDEGLFNSDDAACSDACRIAVCGDGLLHDTDGGVEECDLGEMNSNEGGCTTECKIAVCGDGYTLRDREECDDGEANADNAACTSTCEAAVCGDGLLHEGVEECDEAQFNSKDGTCLPDCTVNLTNCGDGRLDLTEQCDDGNTIGGDGCSARCRLPRSLATTDFTARLVGAMTYDAAIFASNAGDINNDGRDDLLVHAPNAGENGKIYLLNGPFAGQVSVTSANAIITGDSSLDSPVGMGDLNGDGIGDFAFTVDGPDQMELVVVHGPISGAFASSALDTALVTNDKFTAVAGLGDLDGDSVDDFVTTSFGSGLVSQGAAYVVTDLSGNTDIRLANTATLAGAGGGFGGAVATGDVTGDGLPDVVVSAALDSTIHVFSAPTADTSVTEADALLVGDPADLAGSRLGVGDLNGDGVDDIVIGGAETGGGGGVAPPPPSDLGIWVVYGPLSGTVNLTNADAVFVPEPGEAFIDYGFAVGDVNADGTADLLIGSGNNSIAGPSAGAVYLSFGPFEGENSVDDADIIWRGQAVGDDFGLTTLIIDLDGDGHGDPVIGSNRSPAGDVTVFSGSEL